jgi:hypothetical protein
MRMREQPCRLAMAADIPEWNEMLWPKDFSF